MKHPFFRFKIKNQRGIFILLIGCAWDSTPAYYKPIKNCAFALLCPEACAQFTDEQEAQRALKNLKKAIDSR